MQDYSVGYVAAVPMEKGFRWLRKRKGEWSLDDAPDESWEWQQSSRRSAQHLGGRKGRLYLAAEYLDILEPGWGYIRRHSSGIGPIGTFVTEPDLYLKFAALDRTPDTIKSFAQEFGFLRAQQPETKQMANVELDVEDHPEIARAFESDSDSLLLLVEPAFDWVVEHGGINWLIRSWSKANVTNDAKARIDVVDAFSTANPAKLDFRLNLEFASQNVSGEIVASTLSDFLHLQAGMAMAQQVEHRQCRECVRWFSVSGSGTRPEKTYCSDACRMRAYRKRKKSSPRKRRG